MTNRNFPQKFEKEFAEKCRIALEKSWGIEIPKPALKQKTTVLRPLLLREQWLNR
jgi:hypothetical protein